MTRHRFPVNGKLGLGGGAKVDLCRKESAKPKVEARLSDRERIAQAEDQRPGPFGVAGVDQHAGIGQAKIVGRAEQLVRIVGISREHGQEARAKRLRASFLEAGIEIPEERHRQRIERRAPAQAHRFERGNGRFVFLQIDLDPKSKVPRIVRAAFKLGRLNDVRMRRLLCALAILANRQGDEDRRPPLFGNGEFAPSVEDARTEPDYRLAIVLLQCLGELKQLAIPCTGRARRIGLRRRSGRQEGRRHARHDARLRENPHIPHPLTARRKVWHRESHTAREGAEVKC